MEDSTRMKQYLTDARNHLLMAGRSLQRAFEIAPAEDNPDLDWAVLTNARIVDDIDLIIGNGMSSNLPTGARFPRPYPGNVSMGRIAHQGRKRM